MVKAFTKVNYHIKSGFRHGFKNVIFSKFFFGFVTSLSVLLSSHDKAGRIKDNLDARFNEQEDTFDFIIVGAGSAGSLVANRLSENHKVLLLEAGGEPHPLQRIPGMAFFLLNHKQTDWRHRTVPQRRACFASPGRKASWSQGRNLGGSSNLNFMVHLRGSPRDYDYWAKLTGDDSWNYAGCLPYFRRHETYQGDSPDREAHGFDGELKLEIPSYTGMAKEFIRAGQELGYEHVDLNARYEEGFDTLYYPIEGGERRGAFGAFLDPIRDRDTLIIRKYAHVNKILIRGFDNTAFGVEYERHGLKRFAYATKEVIISAGTVESAKLLMLSGIGSKTHLADLGIPLVSDLPVGKNLQDHLATILGPFFIDPPRSFLIDRDITLKSFYEYKSDGNGPLSSSVFQAAAMISSKQAKYAGIWNWPDIQLLLSGMAGHKTFARDMSHAFHLNHKTIKKYYEHALGRDSFFIAVSPSRPLGRGEIVLEKKDAYAQPSINPRYLENDHDMRIMIEGIKTALYLVENTTSFQNLRARFTSKKFPGCEHRAFRSDDYFECYARHFSISLNDPVGTCAMGSGSSTTPLYGAMGKEGVVDSRLQVLGVNHLRVVDASVMPTIVGAHTEAAVYMIAEKGAEMILDTWRNLNTGGKTTTPEPYIPSGVNPYGVGGGEKTEVPGYPSYTPPSTTELPPEVPGYITKNIVSGYSNQNNNGNNGFSGGQLSHGVQDVYSGPLPPVVDNNILNSNNGGGAPGPNFNNQNQPVSGNNNFHSTNEPGNNNGGQNSPSDGYGGLPPPVNDNFNNGQLPTNNNNNGQLPTNNNNNGQLPNNNNFNNGQPPNNHNFNNGQPPNNNNFNNGQPPNRNNFNTGPPPNNNFNNGPPPNNNFNNGPAQNNNFNNVPAQNNNNFNNGPAQNNNFNNGPAQNNNFNNGPPQNNNNFNNGQAPNNNGQVEPTASDGYTGPPPPLNNNNNDNFNGGNPSPIQSSPPQFETTTIYTDPSQISLTSPNTLTYDPRFNRPYEDNEVSTTEMTSQAITLFGGDPLEENPPTTDNTPAESTTYDTAGGTTSFTSGYSSSILLEDSTPSTNGGYGQDTSFYGEGYKQAGLSETSTLPSTSTSTSTFSSNFPLTFIQEGERKPDKFDSGFYETSPPLLTTTTTQAPSASRPEVTLMTHDKKLRPGVQISNPYPDNHYQPPADSEPQPQQQISETTSDFRVKYPVTSTVEFSNKIPNPPELGPVYFRNPEYTTRTPFYFGGGANPGRGSVNLTTAAISEAIVINNPPDYRDYSEKNRRPNDGTVRPLVVYKSLGATNRVPSTANVPNIYYSMRDKSSLDEMHFSEGGSGSENKGNDKNGRTYQGNTQGHHNSGEGQVKGQTYGVKEGGKKVTKNTSKTTNLLIGEDDIILETLKPYRSSQLINSGSGSTQNANDKPWKPMVDQDKGTVDGGYGESMAIDHLPVYETPQELSTSEKKTADGVRRKPSRTLVTTAADERTVPKTTRIRPDISWTNVNYGSSTRTTTARPNTPEGSTDVPSTTPTTVRMKVKIRITDQQNRNEYFQEGEADIVRPYFKQNGTYVRGRRLKIRSKGAMGSKQVPKGFFDGLSNVPVTVTPRPLLSVTVWPDEQFNKEEDEEFSVVEMGPSVSQGSFQNSGFFGKQQDPVKGHRDGEEVKDQKSEESSFLETEPVVVGKAEPFVQQFSGNSAGNFAPRSTTTPPAFVYSQDSYPGSYSASSTTTWRPPGARQPYALTLETAKPLRDFGPESGERSNPQKNDTGYFQVSSTTWRPTNYNFGNLQTSRTSLDKTRLSKSILVASGEYINSEQVPGRNYGHSSSTTWRPTPAEVTSNTEPSSYSERRKPSEFSVEDPSKPEFLAKDSSKTFIRPPFHIDQNLPPESLVYKPRSEILKRDKVGQSPPWAPSRKFVENSLQNPLFSNAHYPEKKSTTDNTRFPNTFKEIPLQDDFTTPVNTELRLPIYNDESPLRAGQVTTGNSFETTTGISSQTFESSTRVPQTQVPIKSYDYDEHLFVGTTPRPYETTLHPPFSADKQNHFEFNDKPFSSESTTEDQRFLSGNAAAAVSGVSTTTNYFHAELGKDEDSSSAAFQSAASSSSSSDSHTASQNFPRNPTTLFAPHTNQASFNYPSFQDNQGSRGIGTFGPSEEPPISAEHTGQFDKTVDLAVPGPSTEVPFNRNINLQQNSRQNYNGNSETEIQNSQQGDNFNIQGQNSAQQDYQNPENFQQEVRGQADSQNVQTFQTLQTLNQQESFGVVNPTRNFNTEQGQSASNAADLSSDAAYDNPSVPPYLGEETPSPLTKGVNLNKISLTFDHTGSTSLFDAPAIKYEGDGEILNPPIVPLVDPQQFSGNTNGAANDNFNDNNGGQQSPGVDYQVDSPQQPLPEYPSLPIQNNNGQPLITNNNNNNGGGQFPNPALSPEFDQPSQPYNGQTSSEFNGQIGPTFGTTPRSLSFGSRLNQRQNRDREVFAGFGETAPEFGSGNSFQQQHPFTQHPFLQYGNEQPGSNFNGQDGNYNGQGGNQNGQNGNQNGQNGNQNGQNGNQNGQDGNHAGQTSNHDGQNGNQNGQVGYPNRHNGNFGQNRNRNGQLGYPNRHNGVTNGQNGNFGQNRNHNGQQDQNPYVSNGYNEFGPTTPLPFIPSLDEQEGFSTARPPDPPGQSDKEEYTIFTDPDSVQLTEPIPTRFTHLRRRADILVQRRRKRRRNGFFRNGNRRSDDNMDEDNEDDEDTPWRRRPNRRPHSRRRLRPTNISFASKVRNPSGQGPFKDPSTQRRMDYTPDDPLQTDESQSVGQVVPLDPLQPDKSQGVGQVVTVPLDPLTLHNSTSESNQLPPTMFSRRGGKPIVRLRDRVRIAIRDNPKVSSEQSVPASSRNNTTSPSSHKLNFTKSNKSFTKSDDNS